MCQVLNHLLRMKQWITKTNKKLLKIPDLIQFLHSNGSRSTVNTEVGKKYVKR